MANLKPAGETDIAHSLVQVAAMLRHASLVMIFSDLLAEPEPVLQALYRLRHGGHDVILFHVLDEAEVHFPFDGMVELEEPESRQRHGPGRRRLPPRRTWTRSKPSATPTAASAFRPAWITCRWTRACTFDRALAEYLMRRSERG